MYHCAAPVCCFTHPVNDRDVNKTMTSIHCDHAGTGICTPNPEMSCVHLARQSSGSGTGDCDSCHLTLAIIYLQDEEHEPGYPKPCHCSC